MQIFIGIALVLLATPIITKAVANCLEIMQVREEKWLDITEAQFNKPMYVAMYMFSKM